MIQIRSSHKCLIFFAGNDSILHAHTHMIPFKLNSLTKYISQQLAGSRISTFVLLLFNEWFRGVKKHDWHDIHQISASSIWHGNGISLKLNRFAQRIHFYSLSAVGGWWHMRKGHSLFAPLLHVVLKFTSFILSSRHKCNCHYFVMIEANAWLKCEQTNSFFFLLAEPNDIWF